MVSTAKVSEAMVSTAKVSEAMVSTAKVSVAMVSRAMVSRAILSTALLSMPVSSCGSHLGARLVTRVDGLTCERMERGSGGPRHTQVGGVSQASGHTLDSACVPLEMTGSGSTPSNFS